MKSSHGIFSQNNIGLVLIILATAAILLPRTLDMSYSVKLLFYSMYAPPYHPLGVQQGPVYMGGNPKPGISVGRLHSVSGPVSAPCPVLPGAVPHYPY